MSAGYSCPCHFSWPLDTQGLKRDPINCEKGWLDYAVRLLSREAVGKGKGQEAVWSEKCRPPWWDASVGLKWKNPTANPKDTKDVLMRKFSALEAHLRSEGRFPSELEEEAGLWRDGKHKELFLFTSFTSLLGKTRGVHSAVEEIQVKVKEMNAKVNTKMLDDIKHCLKSTLGEIENLCANVNVKQKNPSKRKLSELASGKENSCSDHKVTKTENSPSIQSLPQRENSPFLGKASKESIIGLARKMTEKRKVYQNIKPKTDLSSSPNTNVAAIINVNPTNLAGLLNSNGIYLSQVTTANVNSSFNFALQSPEMAAPSSENNLLKSPRVSSPSCSISDNSSTSCSPSSFCETPFQISDSTIGLNENVSTIVLDPSDDALCSNDFSGFVYQRENVTSPSISSNEEEEILSLSFSYPLSESDSSSGSESDSSGDINSDYSSGANTCIDWSPTIKDKIGLDSSKRSEIGENSKSGMILGSDLGGRGSEDLDSDINTGHDLLASDLEHQQLCYEDGSFQLEKFLFDL